jgi:hypothetical protein
MCKKLATTMIATTEMNRTVSACSMKDTVDRRARMNGASAAVKIILYHCGSMAI